MYAICKLNCNKIKISETGSAQEKMYFEPKHKIFNQIFMQETEILMEKMNYQLEKDSVFIRAEYDDKLLQDTEYYMNKFNVSMKINIPRRPKSYEVYLH